MFLSVRHTSGRSNRMANAMMVTVAWMLLLLPHTDAAALRAGSPSSSDLCLCSDCCAPSDDSSTKQDHNNIMFATYELLGETCEDLHSRMLSLSHDDDSGQSCALLQTWHREYCCKENDAEQNDDIRNGSVLAPHRPCHSNGIRTLQQHFQGDPGEFPVCEVCADGSVPTLPSQVTVTFGIDGNPSCLELYQMGQNGEIDDQICMPLQDFFDGPCGCYVTTTEPPGGPPSPTWSWTPPSAPVTPGNPPTISYTTFAPNTAPPSQNPIASPTGSPRESPTDSPVDPSTESPTESPSDSPTGSPTESPRDSPTDSPVLATNPPGIWTPVTSLSNSPTLTPVSAPLTTSSPTSSPTRAPTESPTIEEGISEDTLDTPSPSVQPVATTGTPNSSLPTVAPQPQVAVVVPASSQTPTRSPISPATPTPIGITETNAPMCFSGSNTVEVLGRGTILLEHLSIGDHVKLADHTYSRVYTYSHFDRHSKATYRQVHATGLAQPLEISSDHILFVNDVPTRASSVRVGDRLTTMTSSILPEEEEPTPVVVVVTHIDVVQRTGIFAPVTEQGELLVSGVRASSYVAVLPHLSVSWQQWAYHAGHAPLRALCAMDGYRRLETYTEGIADSIHWVAMMVIMVAEHNAVVQWLALATVTPVVLVLYGVEQVVWVHPGLLGALLLGVFVYRRNQLARASGRTPKAPPR